MQCLCVNVYCHRVTTQLQLINISKNLTGACELAVRSGIILCVCMYIGNVTGEQTDVVCGVTLRSLLNRCQCFRKTSCPHLQGRMSFSCFDVRGSSLLRNSGTYLQDFMASHPRKYQSLLLEIHFLHSVHLTAARYSTQPTDLINHIFCYSWFHLQSSRIAGHWYISPWYYIFCHHTTVTAPYIKPVSSSSYP
jgi:hypothetical protein